MNGMLDLSITTLIVIDFFRTKFRKSIMPLSSADRPCTHPHISSSPTRPCLPPLWAFKKRVIILSFSACLRVSSLSAMNYRWRAWIGLLNKSVISFWKLFQIFYVKKKKWFQMQGVFRVCQTEKYFWMRLKLKLLAVCITLCYLSVWCRWQCVVVSFCFYWLSPLSLSVSAALLSLFSSQI